MAAAERVLVVAPLGRDAAIVTQILDGGGIESAAVTTAALCDQLRVGPGAVLVTEEALNDADECELIDAVRAQPPWSDVPFLLLLSSDDVGPARAPVLAALQAAANVTVLQRPVPAITLLTAVQASLRARRRQYEVRDVLTRERTAREQAEAATRSKDEFLASVSHELRTPLSAILLWSSLLEAGKLTDDQKVEAVRSIKISAQAQSALVEDLLDVARTMAGKLRVELAPHALDPIVQRAIEVVEPTARARGVQLASRFSGGDCVALLDPDRVQQIAWNLLTNAIKFTPEGGHVTITVTREDQTVVLTVADTGEGIEPELLPHVFERFRQGESRGGRRQAGLGLGLPIVQQLVELQGGTIEVCSAGRERGTTFTVRLPAMC